MSEHEPHDHMDAGASDQLDHAGDDQLDHAGDDQLVADSLQTPAGDGATTGDLESAPAFPDPMPPEDDDQEADDVQDLQEQASQPNPYSAGYGVANKFPAQDPEAGGGALERDAAEDDSR